MRQTDLCPIVTLLSSSLPGRFNLVLLSGLFLVFALCMCIEHSLFVVVHFSCFILVFSLKFAGKD